MSGDVAAIDLGATSGRVIVGRVGANELALEQVARFPNEPVRTIDGLHWDILGLYGSVLDGLRAAAAGQRILSIGVDSWAVDYALLRNGRMLGEPYHYRDERNAAGQQATHEIIPPEELYRQNGLQVLPFNTLYQLAAERESGLLELADTMLLIPDLLTYWLTGRPVAEATNASTTGLFDFPNQRWNFELVRALGLSERIFPQVVSAGDRVGELVPSVRAHTGLGLDTAVHAVGSHDTASAVVGTPLSAPDAAYISSGTWGLVGVELEHPIRTEASRAANFTNEGGVDGRIRFLHNVMGLWMLTECVHSWERAGVAIDLPALLRAAADAAAPTALLDSSDPVFLAPADMPGAIDDWCRAHGIRQPDGAVETTRLILESLAHDFAAAVQTAGELAGRTVPVIHIVGGGAQNALLCQLTADHAGIPVLAGPVEATAIGNVLVQARAAGLVSGDLETLRALVAQSFQPVRYVPRHRSPRSASGAA